jgi:hypothetical protein
MQIQIANKLDIHVYWLFAGTVAVNAVSEKNYNNL